MSLDDSHNDPRRRFLQQALSLGLLAGGMGYRLDAIAALLGTVPGELPKGKSIFELSGSVTINGVAATTASRIAPGDVLETGNKGLLIAVVNRDALLLRANTRLEIAAASAAKGFFRLVSGAMLSVFGKRDEEYQIRTATATIGIRGTGVYAETDPEQTYLCTCYGEVELRSASAPEQSEIIRSRHHDAPRYLLAKPRAGRHIVAAGFRDHTDQELMTLEALVGRKVPFNPADPSYERPRRERY